MAFMRQLALDLFPARPVQGGDSPKVKTIGDFLEENQCYRCLYGPVYCYTHAKFGVGMKCYGFKAQGQHQATSKRPHPHGTREQGLTHSIAWAEITRPK
jgi:hypothetical protein